jgi:hypothetical protein
MSADVRADTLACVVHPGWFDRDTTRPGPSRGPGLWQRAAMRACETCPILTQCERDISWAKPASAVMAGIWFTQRGHRAAFPARFDRKDPTA